jgi:hypothetical protein
MKLGFDGGGVGLAQQQYGHQANQSNSKETDENTSNNVAGTSSV